MMRKITRPPSALTASELPEKGWSPFIAESIDRVRLSKVEAPKRISPGVILTRMGARANRPMVENSASMRSPARSRRPTQATIGTMAVVARRSMSA